MRTSPKGEKRGSDMRTSVSVSVLSVILAITIASPALVDEAAARKKLEDDYIPFTTEKFFHYVFMDNKKMVGLFLEAGMPVDSADKNGRTALHGAARHDDGKMLAQLLKAGAKVNVRTKEGDTPLCSAADSERLKNVLALLQAGADARMVCSWGKTALHIAADKGDAQMVEALLKAGAGLEARDKYSQTPLYFAVRAERPDALNALIAAGADVNAKFKHGQSALHEAVSKGRPEYVSALLKGGAAVDQRDSQGKTPLFDAVTYDRVEVIPVLLAAGADPAAKNKSGETMQQIAERARSARALDLIKGARKVDVPPAKTIPPKSPAAAAGASSGDPKADLKNLGFNFDAETFFNRVETEDVRAIGLFLKAGMDPGSRNKSGRTVLWEAVEG